MLAGWVFSGGKPDLIHYAVPLMLPAAVLSGSLFALLGAELRADSHNPQPAIGVLTTGISTLQPGVSPSFATSCASFHRVFGSLANTRDDTDI